MASFVWQEDFSLTVKGFQLEGFILYRQKFLSSAC